MCLQKGFSVANILGVLLGLLCVGAILGAYYFIYQTRDNTFEKNIETLNKLQQLDANWSSSILKTRSYTLQDFDQLALYMIKIRDALRTLDRQGMLDIERVGVQTVNQYQIYKNSLKAKNEAVEQYKSQQAILRNSVRYLPTVSKQLQHALVEKNTLKAKKLNELIIESSLSINQFLLSVTNNDEAQEQLIELAQQSIESDEIQRELQNYLMHAELILKHRPKARRMLQTAMSNNMGELSANVIHEYNRIQQLVKQCITDLQQIMLAGGVLLLMVTLWFLLRLRKSNVKVMVADAENEATHQQLLQVEEHLGEVNNSILQAGQTGLN